jgi:SUZ domain
MSSYDRLLVHRTAQHWGLDTSTLSQGPDHGSILAVRTVRTGIPQIKLTDLPVTMEEPVIPAQRVPPMAAAAAGGDGAAAAAPKVLVRRRGDRPRGNGNRTPQSPAQHNGFSHHQHSSIEARELEYERTRARIFGGGSENDSNGGGNNPNNPQQGMYAPQHIMPQHQQYMMANHYAMQMQQGQQGQGQGHAYNASGSPRPHPQHSNQHIQHSGGNTINSNSANSNINYAANTNSTKAQLRNRQEDLSDPDFRRGRRNTGPRFDPGFGEDMIMMNGGGPQGMYVRPTYSSEFPTLGGGGGGGGGGYMQHPYAYAAQGNFIPNNGGAAAQGYPVVHPHQHMYAAAAAGGGGGGNGGGVNNNNNRNDAHAAHQMQMQFHQQHQQGYAVAIGPYGPQYIPIQPGDGAGGMIPVMYMTSGGGNSTGGSGMYHPGSPPNSMSAGGGGGGGMHMMPMSPSGAAALHGSGAGFPVMSPKGGGGGGVGPGNWNQYQQQQQYHHQYSHGGGGGTRQQQQGYQQQPRSSNNSSQYRNQQRIGGGGGGNGGSSGSRESTSVSNAPRAESSTGSEKPVHLKNQQSKTSVDQGATSACVEK